MTKFGVVGFSEALRQEGRSHSGVRVTCVEPGFVEPSSRATTRTRWWSRRSTRCASRSARCSSAEDIADAILYAVGQPEQVAINEILVRPEGQTR